MGLISQPCVPCRKWECDGVLEVETVVAVAAETVPAETVTVPAETVTVPVETETVPAETETVPAETETVAETDLPLSMLC